MSNGPSTRVYYSSDSGKSWNIKWLGNSGGSGGLKDVSFVNSKLGFLVGTSGMTSQYYSYIYKTTDGGMNWQNITKARLPSMYSICFVNANVGFIVGLDQGYLGEAAGGSIFKTTDGGITWTLQISGTTTNLNCVSFFNTEIGTIVGKSGIILRTTTGGEITNLSWKRILSGTSAAFRSVCFIPSSEKSLKWSDTVSQASDEGAGIFLLKEPRTIIGEPHGVFFADSNYGMAADYGQIYKTTNGGKDWLSTTWSGNLINMRWRPLYGVSMPDTNNAYVVGDNGTILHTTNFGKTWTQQVSNTSYGLWDVCFKTTHTGFIVGEHGTILKTNNGGSSWVSQNSGITNSLLSVYFMDTNNGTIVGAGGIILKTTDGGSTWNMQPSGTTNNLCGVSFRDVYNGIAVGEDGIILTTKDSGNTWLAVESGINANLFGTAFKDSVQLVVGDYGTILERKVDIEDIIPHDTISYKPYLKQNYPNPFNTRTSIGYFVPSDTKVSLKIFDLLGREIATLVNDEKNTGSYNVVFNGKNLASGTYFYQLKTNNFVQTKKMILLK